MTSWWQGTESIRGQLASGVESLKKATQDIANEVNYIHIILIYIHITSHHNDSWQKFMS